jgi:hypothetical protein
VVLRLKCFILPPFVEDKKRKNSVNGKNRDYQLLSKIEASRGKRDGGRG